MKILRLSVYANTVSSEFSAYNCFQWQLSDKGSKRGTSDGWGFEQPGLKPGERTAASPSSDRTTELIGCPAGTHPSRRAVSGRGQIIRLNHILCQKRHQQVTHHHILWLIQCPQLLCLQLHLHPFPSSLSFLLFIYSTLCNFPCERPHRYYKTPPLMSAPDKRAAVLFILSWLAGSFNGNLNKLLNATMKLHLCIQCQCKDPPRIPVNSQIQPVSLSFLVLLFSCSPAVCHIDGGIDRRGCRV